MRFQISVIFMTAYAGCATADKPYTELYYSESEPGNVLLLDPVALEAERQERKERDEEARQKRRETISRALASRDIVVGMTRDEVSQVWGEPHGVEYAGDEGSPNQRWTYSEGWSSRYGMAPERVLYFENGQVSGWETRNR